MALTKEQQAFIDAFATTYNKKGRLNRQLKFLTVTGVDEEKTFEERDFFFPTQSEESFPPAEALPTDSLPTVSIDSSPIDSAERTDSLFSSTLIG